MVSSGVSETAINGASWFTSPNQDLMSVMDGYSGMGKFFMADSLLPVGL